MIMEVIISTKFKEKLNEIELCLPQRYKGEIIKEEEGLWLLKDEKKKSVCGIIDAGSFLEAILESEIKGTLLNGWQN